MKTQEPCSFLFSKINDEQSSMPTLSSEIPPTANTLQLQISILETPLKYTSNRKKSMEEKLFQTSALALNMFGSNPKSNQSICWLK